MYTTGAFSFLNRQTNINFDNRFVVFNIGEMPKQVKPVVMFLILDYVYMKMKKDRERKLLVIDEAWSLLSRAEDSSYIFEIVKTCRKFNLGLLLITQDVADLLNSQAGNAVLSNSAYTIMLRQKPAVIDRVGATFHLSSSERNRLLTANVGEGLIIMENDHSEIKIVASEKEHELITTNADELLKQENKEEVVKKKQNINVKVDADNGLFRKKELTNHDIDYLLEKDYKILSAIGLHGGRREDYLVMPRSNESPIHFFLCKTISDFVKQYTEKVWLYQTKKPDIVFQADGKIFAIEIETGSRLTYHAEMFDKKVEQLKKEYGENWLIVVSDRKERAVCEAWQNDCSGRSGGVCAGVSSGGLRRVREGSVGAKFGQITG